MSREWVPIPYMEAAMEWSLKRAGSGLMLDPGMRKTSITLAVIDILRHAGEIRKTLVIAPLRVCQTVWRQEGKKWANFNHLKIANLCGLRVTERATMLAADFDVYLINPESCVKVLDLLGKDFDLLVLDESTKFKDTQTQRFKALKKKLYDFKRRMILTGTPVPNGLADLFGQMFVVDFGAALGKYITHFRMEFCHQRPGDAYGWHLNRGAPELIYKRVDQSLMRLDSKVLGLPPMVPNFIMTDLPDQRLRDMYDSLKKDFVAQIDGDHSLAVFNAAAVGTKLRQLANGFVYEERPYMADGQHRVHRVATRLHTEKLDALEELIEEMQGRPLLVAYEFEEDAAMIAERFPWAINLGKSKKIERDIEAFNRGELPMVYAHPASVGHGLNMQEACNTICWYGITWNLEHYIQFNGRVHRSGQQAGSVMVHHIVCRGTKDEDVMKALEDKGATQDAFNEANEPQRVVQMGYDAHSNKRSISNGNCKETRRTEAPDRTDRGIDGPHREAWLPGPGRRGDRYQQDLLLPDGQRHQDLAQ